MAIDNRQDFDAVPTFRKPHVLAPALSRGKGGVNETLALINGPFLTQRIRQLGKDLTQDLPLTPLLEPAMNGFVVGIALRQEMPLGTGIQNPKHGLQDR